MEEQGKTPSGRAIPKGGYKPGPGRPAGGKDPLRFYTVEEKCKGCRGKGTKTVRGAGRNAPNETITCPNCGGGGIKYIQKKRW